MWRNKRQFTDEGGILGVYSAGGSGHKQALFAIKNQVAEKNPTLPFYTQDILSDTLPAMIARYITRDWDRAKAAGDVEKLKKLYRGTVLGFPHHRIIDLFVFLPAFFSVSLWLFRRPDVTKIVDTQPLATKAIIRAARFTALVTGRSITVTKVMTDLPTVRAEHFSNPSLRLSHKDRCHYEIMSVPPMKQKTDESEHEWFSRQERFWNQRFGLSLKGGQVRYHDYPLRQPFLLKTQEVAEHLAVTTGSDGEKELLAALAKGAAVTLNPLTFKIKKDHFVGLIALGSQAVRQATKAYLFDVIAVAKKQASPARPWMLFIACGEQKPNEESLFQEVAALLEEVKEALGEHLTVLPLTFQKAETLAFLKARANFGIYSAGGITTMELVSVARGQLFIHSGAKEEGGTSSHQQFRTLIKGIPLWEAGNAKHLVKERGAHVVVPGKRFRAFLENEFIHRC